MTNSIDPIRYWTRELAHLRTQALKTRRGSAEPPVAEVTDAALAVCDTLLRDLAGAHLESDRLRGEIRTEAAAWERLFDIMPSACLLTDSAGFIVKANDAAGVLLNVSVKHLKDRELLVFSQNREAFSGLLQRLARSGEQLRTTLIIRPRERKAAKMEVIAIPLSEHHSALWLWFLRPTEEPRKPAPDADVALVNASFSSEASEYQ